MFFIYLVPFLLVIGITSSLSLLIIWLVRKLKLNKRLTLIALLPFFVLLYFVFTAFYPPESFYKEDFSEVTGVDFPETGKILYKEASYPDHHGDYTSTSMIKVDEEFFESLPGILEKKGFKRTNNSTPVEELTILELHRSSNNEVLSSTDKKVEFDYSLEHDLGNYYYVGFLTDKQTLIIRRVSW